MSTITKLDPRIRRERAERREMLRGLRALADKFSPTTERGHALRTVIPELERIRKSSRRTGARKTNLFTRAARQLASGDDPVVPRF